MNYKDLKNVAEARNIMIKDLAASMDMTPNGFKVSIENETFPIGKVRDLCAALGITVEQFFSGGTASYDFDDTAHSVAAESAPFYGAPVGRRGNEIDMIATLISHISWLEAEIDRLRAENERLTSK